MEGKLIIVTAPSGSGKTSIVRHLLENIPGLNFSVSATTRPRREGEMDGQDYYYLSEESFRARIDNGDFLEWEEVYPGRLYGTLHLEVERKMNDGHHVIFDIDVKGAVNIKEKYPDTSLAIFVRPPSQEALEARLRGRGSEDEDSLRIRLDRAAEELTYEDKFDTTIVNDELETAQQEATDAVMSFIGNTVNNS